MGFVDLHTHVLPGLDDGAKSAKESMTMLRGLAALGFDLVCATPHQKEGLFLPDLADIRAVHQATCERLISAKLSLSLWLAAEHMWDSVFYHRMMAQIIPSYNDGPAFLIEFPLGRELPLALSKHLFDQRIRGKLPVIAHPERYEPLWQCPEITQSLAQQCAMVVDLGALAGYHGPRQAKAARGMVKNGIAHAAASDAHTPADIQVAAEGIAWIRKKIGEDAVNRLLDTNPRRILSGELPT